MEKHACKLCDRSFANGRALGGHMRSHMATLAPCAPPKKDSLSYSSSSSSEGEEQREEEEEEREGSKGLGYGLRENPKRSIRLVDPEFSFAVDAGSVVQDRESETESPRAQPRRRSKRCRGSAEAERPDRPETEELVSSVSDTTPEEDVARCLMMLSRDIWMRSPDGPRFEAEDESEAEADAEAEEDEELKSSTRLGRSKFQCGTCKKVFRSYQALGGHRASHKKSRGCLPATASKAPETDWEVDHPKIHQCPVCFRVFGSGQALGGHKRSHLSGPATAGATSSKMGDSLIDLNLPAPVEDDEASQIELSAVSDVEFADSDV